MFSGFKTATANLLSSLKTIGSNAKYYVAPWVISAGRITSAAGGSLFYLLNFMKWLTGTTKHPASIPASVLVICFNAWMNTTTRAPAIFRQFRTPSVPQIEDESENHCSSCKGSCHCHLGCDFICGEKPILPSDYNLLEGHAKAAYLLTSEDQFYYIDKIRRTCSEITLDATQLQNLKTIFNINNHAFSENTNLYEALSTEQLKNITTITKHAHSELALAGILIFTVFRTLGLLSSSFVSLAAYLGTWTLSEFIAENVFDDTLNTTHCVTPSIDMPPACHEDYWKLYLVSGVGFFFAVSNLYAFLSYNVEKITQNSRYFALRVQNRDIVWDKYCTATLVTSVLGLISTPATAYFSTYNGLGKLPFVVPPALCDIIASISSMTSVSNYLMSNIPATYYGFRGSEKKITFTATRPWEKPFKWSTYVAGSFDTAANSISGFTGFVNTYSKKLHINAYNPYFITAGVATSCSSFIVNFMLFVHEAINDTLYHYHKSRGEAIETLPKANIEASIVQEQARPYQQSEALSIPNSDNSVNTTDEITEVTHLLSNARHSRLFKPGESSLPSKRGSTHSGQTSLSGSLENDWYDVRKDEAKSTMEPN